MIHGKYDHSRSQSADFLRKTIAHMSKQDASFVPISYALWYEYVSQNNNALNESIERYLSNNKVLNDDTTSKLYQDHLIAPGLKKLQGINCEMGIVISKVSNSTREVGEKSRDFSDALANWRQTIEPDPNNDYVLQKMLQQTDQLRNSMETLIYSLAMSQEEILKLKRELATVRIQATTDHLTGLLNRHGFEKALEELFGDPIVLVENTSLMLLDIDHFKKVNDNFGHLVGDKVIRTIAELIRKNIKGQDVGVRYGGEEFLVLLPNTSLPLAQKLGEKIRKHVASSQIKNRVTNKALERITVSIGIAQVESGDELSAVIKRADKALYDAKSAGRNKVTVQE